MSTTVGSWLWDAKTDIVVFAGSAAAALLLVALGHATGISAGPSPEWMYFAFVIGIDVAHVWSTVFRTYLDGAELRRRPWVYAGFPMFLWFVGFLLYSRSPLTFWRVLAYLAVFHFIRQQIGWAAIYRAKARLAGWKDKLCDDALLYLATGVPILIWHASPSREFKWFVAGDFVNDPRVRAALLAVVPAAKILYAAGALAFTLRFLFVWRQQGKLEIGRAILVGSTAACWWIGIVATNSDFDFTVTNVTIHGIPYMVLLWKYARARTAEIPRSAVAGVVGGGVLAFVAVVVGLAFLEEFAWDRYVWHDHGWIFGDGPALRATTLSILVPLLALPQATHYALDAFLWRRRDVTPAQSVALGFSRA